MVFPFWVWLLNVRPS